MRTGINYADQKGPRPGDDKAVHMQKSIAMGMTAPKSERKTKPIGMMGGKAGVTHVVGLTNR